MKVRFYSFLQDLYALAIVAVTTALVDFLGSPALQATIEEHWGTGMTSMIIITLVANLKKHLRNTQVLKDANFGGLGPDQRPPLV